MCFAPQRRELYRHLNVKKGPKTPGFYTFEMCFVPQRRELFRHLNVKKGFDMCFAPQRRALFRHLNVKKGSVPFSFLHFWLGKVLRVTTACTFFDSSTSKSGPTLVCFVYFDLEMCFAPQRCALFDIGSQLLKMLRS